jgi:hypothetical protein
MKDLILKKLQSNIQGTVFFKKEFTDYYSVDASSYQIYPKIIVVAKNEKDIINTIKIAKKNQDISNCKRCRHRSCGKCIKQGHHSRYEKF